MGVFTNTFGNTLATQGALLNPKFDFAPIVEDRARIANKTYSFTGTNIFVDGSVANDTGNGLTPATAKKYLQSGYTAASNGSIIHCKGTIDLTGGANGYMYCGTVGKSVMFLGDTDNKADTIITQSVSAGVALIRKYVGDLVVIKNMTIQTANDLYVMMSDSLPSDSATVLDNVKLYNSHSTTIKPCFISADTNHGQNRWHEFHNCDIGGRGGTVYLPNMSATETLLITGSNSIFRGTVTPAFAQVNGTGGVSIYDVTFEQSANTFGLIFGTDTGVPVSTLGLIDIRNCKANYIGTGRGHLILLGRGVPNVYFINNQLETLNIDDVTNLCLVIKSESTSLANYVVKGNRMKGIRPLAPLGKYMDIQHNIAISTASNYCGVNFINAKYLTVEYNLHNNIFENNTIYAPSHIFDFSPTQTAEDVKISLLTGTFTNNKYCTNTGKYIYNIATIVEFADKDSFWGSAFDNSKMYTGIAQP